MKRIFLILAFLTGLSFADQDRTIVEALLRMENFDLSGSEKAQGAVDRFLAKHLGTEEGIRLIEKYDLPREQALLQFALANPANPLGTRAAKILQKRGKTGDIGKALSEAASAPSAIILLRSLGETEDLNQRLPELVRDKKLEPAVRLEAQKAMADLDPQTLLGMLDGLPERKPALDLLLTHRDKAVRDAATKLAELPVGSLPSYEVLGKRRGKIDKGKAVYARSCAVCHLPSAFKIDFGPNLSEIGSKLPREALFQAIVEPNAGISMGYEAVQVDVKNDGGTFIGFLSSDTEKSITLRMPGGLAQTFEKKQVKTTKLPASLMPEGLALTMSEAELVDLVEYLASLKKK